MGKVSIYKDTYLGHEIEVIRERANVPSLSKLEPRLGVMVRYGLKFNGEMTDWSEFIEAVHDRSSASRLMELGVQRALALDQGGTGAAA